MIARKENARWQAGADRTEHYAEKFTARRTLKQSAKRLIVSVALWGFIPPASASWLLSRLGLVSE
jgi:hypothetical protein